LIIILFDTSSYFFGKFIGKKKILSTISPNKTYAGLVGGIFTTLILTFLLNNQIKIFNFNNFLVFTIIIIFFAFLGDILESYFKRKVKIKDSSSLLPGHGGFFDRMDGFIMSAIPLLILVNIL